MFEEETISNYEGHQENQVENDQEPEEETTHHPCCCFIKLGNFCYYRKKIVLQKKQQTVGKTCQTRSIVTKGTNAKINSF